MDLLKACRTNSYSKVEQAVRDLVLEGYAAAQIAAQLAQRTALPDEALTDNQRAQIAIRIAQVGMFYNNNIISISKQNTHTLSLCLCHTQSDYLN